MYAKKPDIDFPPENMKTKQFFNVKDGSYEVSEEF